MPPEIRIANVDKTSVVQITFTKEMNFPDDLKDLINDQKDALQKTLHEASQESSPTANKLVDETPPYFEVYITNRDDEVSNEPLKDWSVISAEPKKIEMLIKLSQPLAISQGTIDHELVIQAQLGQFTDIDGLTLPQSVIKRQTIQRQFAS